MLGDWPHIRCLPSLLLCVLIHFKPEERSLVSCLKKQSLEFHPRTKTAVVCNLQHQHLAGSGDKGHLRYIVSLRPGYMRYSL